MNFRTSRRTLIASLALAPVMMKAMPAFALTDQQELVDKARISFDKLITALEFGELPGYVKKAKAVMIFPDIFKAGLVIGGQGGSGLLLVRDAAKGWSQPAFYTLAEGSLGLQIGGQSSETVFTIMSQKALDAILDNQMKFGGDMSVAAGRTARASARTPRPISRPMSIPSRRPRAPSPASRSTAPAS